MAITEKGIRLTDVMLGLERWQLNTLLPSSCFTFLWGLLMQANRPHDNGKRFQNPIRLSVQQAITIGGGASRQAVHQKQQLLKDMTLNEEHLVKVQSGDNTGRSAEYAINYELLLARPNGKIDAYIPLLNRKHLTSN